MMWYSNVGVCGITLSAWVVFQSLQMWYFGLGICGISVSANVIFHSRNIWYFSLGICGILLSAHVVFLFWHMWYFTLDIMWYFTLSICSISLSAYVIFRSRLTVAPTLPVPSDLQNDVGWRAAECEPCSASIWSPARLHPLWGQGPVAATAFRGQPTAVTRR